MRIVPVVLRMLLFLSLKTGLIAGLVSCPTADVDQNAAKKGFLYSLCGLMEARATLSLGREPNGATIDKGVIATVELTGGPVRRLAFEMTNAQLLASGRVDVQVEADGREFAIVVLPEDLE